MTTENWDDDHSLFKLFGARWLAWRKHKDFLVYLNPSLLGLGGPWDEYFFTPYGKLALAVAGSPESGNFTGAGIMVDPKTFHTASVALAGAEDFYQRTAGTFNTMVSDLSSEASQYKGQAGEAFAHLIHNLYSTANSVSSQMGLSTSASSYSGKLSQAGDDSWNFIVGIWNTLLGWSEML